MRIDRIATNVYPNTFSDPRVDPSTTTPDKCLTIISGAGMSIYAGAPSTEELTTIVANRPITSQIARILTDAGHETNFEDFLHFLEELELIRDSEASRSSRVLQPFLDFSPAIHVSLENLRQERYAVLETIGKRFNTVDYNAWSPLYQLLRPLLEDFNLDHFTLNYDLLPDVITFALSARTGKPWYSGFPSVPEPNAGASPFLSSFYANP